MKKKVFKVEYTSPLFKDEDIMILKPKVLPDPLTEKDLKSHFRKQRKFEKIRLKMMEDLDSLI